jgi:hypothetical protein
MGTHGLPVYQNLQQHNVALFIHRLFNVPRVRLESDDRGRRLVLPNPRLEFGQMHHSFLCYIDEYSVRPCLCVPNRGINSKTRKTDRQRTDHP